MKCSSQRSGSGPSKRVHTLCVVSQLRGQVVTVELELRDVQEVNTGVEEVAVSLMQIILRTYQISGAAITVFRPTLPEYPQISATCGSD
jgi:hypothetical protein